MNKNKPLRHCCICNLEDEKNNLIRIVRQKDGAVILDRSGKANGRGAYLCTSAECLKKARKSKRLDSSLSAKIGEDIYSQIEEIINGNK